MRLLIALTIPWALVAAVVAATAAAEPLDRLLATPAMTQMPEGAALVYRQRRTIGPGNGDLERTIRLERHAARASVVATTEGDGARQIAEFRGTSGNPIALVFLESVVGRISEATGSNPFYLRRRIKEAARERVHERPVRAAGAEAPAREFVLRPFEGTEHADALGAYATLELIFRLSDAVPGRFVSLRATAGEYAEEMLLDDTT